MNATRRVACGLPQAYTLITDFQHYLTNSYLPSFQTLFHHRHYFDERFISPSPHPFAPIYLSPPRRPRFVPFGEKPRGQPSAAGLFLPNEAGE